MRMSITILFNMPVVNSIPSIGGFEITTTEGKEIGFDFLESCAGADPHNPYLVNWELRDEDTSTFPDMIKLIHDLQNITKITECYLDFEGFEENELIPKSLCIVDWSIEMFSKSPVKEANNKLIKIQEKASDKTGHIYDCIFKMPLLETFRFDWVQNKKDRKKLTNDNRAELRVQLSELQSDLEWLTNQQLVDCRMDLQNRVNRCLELIAEAEKDNLTD